MILVCSLCVLGGVFKMVESFGLMFELFEEVFVDDFE